VEVEAGADGPASAPPSGAAAAAPPAGAQRLHIAVSIGVLGRGVLGLIVLLSVLDEKAMITVRHESVIYIIEIETISAN
jgi:hypothetical protein